MLRVGYKDALVYAFLPNKSGVFEVWETDVDVWTRSRIAKTLGAFALIDPSERGIYDDAAPCNVLKYASNNVERHYLNVDKRRRAGADVHADGGRDARDDHGAVYRRAAVPGQAIADAAAKKQEVLDRCALVGCVPRLVFSGEKFLDGLTDIIDASTNVASTAPTC